MCMSEEKDTLVTDIETKKSFADVGGKDRIQDLGVAVVGVYSYFQDKFIAYEEHELPLLQELLLRTSHIIGFNIKQFDIPVLAPYSGDEIFRHMALTDIFEDAVQFLGHRIGLDAVSRATLGRGKSGHGLEALEWFKQGRVEEVKTYCLDDVRLTRDLYEYGKTHGHILFESRGDGKLHSIPTTWGRGIKMPVAKIIDDAFLTRSRVRIEYISSEDSEGAGFRKSRLIDIYAIKGNGEIKAFCHLRNAVRDFRANRILKAELTDEHYALPQDAQPALF